ncbi:MAG: hypothetical protein ABEH35_07705, partial [Haloarculaceae archaeon]
MQASRFTTWSAVVALIGCVVVFLGAALSFGLKPGPRGSFGLSALVGAVFAVQNLQSVRGRGRPRFAAAVMATALGAWLIIAPLQYGIRGVLTAVTQFGGMLLAAFSAYTALVAVEGYLGDVEGSDENGYD